MDLLETLFFDNPIYVWIIAGVVSLLVFVVSVILRRVIIHRIIPKDERLKNGLEIFLTGITVHTRGYFVFVLAIYIGSMFLNLSARFENILGALIITVALIQVGYWGNNLINFWINRRIRQELERNNTNATTLSSLGLIARIIFWSILILLILENVTGIQVDTLVASLGITGIAVALAVQNILGDLFASLSITMDRPFVIGDFIIVDDFSGTVEYIGLKSTRVRSLSGEQLIFSNSDLLNSRIRNFKRMDRRRIVFTLNTTYQTSVEMIEKIPRMVESIVTNQSHTVFDRAHFKQFGDFSLVFEVVYFIDTPDYLMFMDTQQNINLEIIRRFTEAGIEFAYPTQVLYVQDQRERRPVG
jgi:small-conductance mechanosensitive channel